MDISPEIIQILTSPVTVIVTLTAAAGGGIFGALVGIYQSVLSRRAWLAQTLALKEQTRANELEAFCTMNMKFLDIIEKFEEHINDKKIGEKDLSSTERRAIDRYFYLANMEYILHKENVIDRNLSEQWLEGIKSVSHKKAFVERWKSTVSKFTLDKDFRNFFEQQIKEKQENIL